MAAGKPSSQKLPKSKKRQFSGFSKAEAFKQLQLGELEKWTLNAPAVTPSDFFLTHLQRLEQHFDLESYEESKKLVIDAILAEAIEPFDRLKIFKGAQLESDLLAGYVDYLVAQRKRYLSRPLLCVVEAKRDDFEQGLAQCLVEMQACQWQNQQDGHHIEVYGIVTNGDSWRFYRLDKAALIYETATYAVGDMEQLLGRLRLIFEQCQRHLEIAADE
jgi:hypothetical protein